MKLTILLMCIGILQVQASVFSQRSDISLKLNDVTMGEVFNTLEGQYNYKFIFSDDLVDINRKVTISVDNENIDAVIASILDKTQNTYKILDNNLIVVFPSQLMNQQNVVSGVVSDQNGEPLPGVNVMEKGTTNGAVTDLDGKYTIAVSSDDAVLVFSFIGYLTEEVQLAGQNTMDLTLVEDIKQLDEVVVIGYGSRQKKDLTGAVSQINSDEITKTTSMSPELAMQGRMPGVFISNPGSDPNARPTIRIRGVSTLGYNDPLYVIDGIPLTEGGAANNGGRVADQRGDVNVFNMINPNDIESISVLKDASATAIYGVRASNGVILITTKRGKAGKPKVDFSARYGIQNVYKTHEVMGIQDYVNTHLEAWNNNPAVTPNPAYYGFYKSDSATYLGNNPNYTDAWVEAAKVKNAPIQDYNVSISGGNEMSTYSVGVGYAGQENALYYSEFQRYSAYLNSDHQLTDYLKVGESYRFVYSQTAEDDGPGLDAAFGAPWQPLYDPNGYLGYALPGREVDGTFLSRGYGNGTRSNFLGSGELNTIQRDLLRNMGTFYAELTPFKGFRARGTVSFDYYTNTQQRYLHKNRGLFGADQGAPYDGEGNTYRRRVNENINIVKEFLIGYNASFGNHNVDIILNAMDQQVRWNNSQASISYDSPITSWEQRRIDEGWDMENKGLLYERNPSGLQGYMGRLSYHYNNKYYVDATVRRDGSSKFGPGYKWGTFPSFAGAWRISSEGFMEGLAWLDDLKIRAGWGQTGNQETRDFAFLSLVNFNPKYSLGSGGSAIGDGTIYPAAVLGDFPIVDMSWETVTTTNVGFDAILAKNRLALTAEYYSRLTDGILQEIVIPRVIGALSQPVVNLAQVENKGIEVMASFNDRIGDLGYSASFNLTTINNKVLDLYRGKPSGGSYGRIEEGRSINFLYGYKTDGVFQTQQEVDDWLASYEDPGNESQKAPGDIRFVDFQGAPTEEDGEEAYRSLEPDGKVNSYDQTYLGKTIPGYFYGLNLGLDYKNFDFVIDFRGIGDVQKIRTAGKQSVGAGGGNYLTEYLDRWTETNPSNTIPRAIDSDPSGNNRVADRHVEDAGFFRFQNFQLGYSFGGGVLQRIGVSNLRTYLSGTNLLVVSPYSGLDPENDSTPTTFMLGVNLSF